MLLRFSFDPGPLEPGKGSLLCEGIELGGRLGATRVVIASSAETSFAKPQTSKSCPVLLLQLSQSGTTYQFLSIGLSF